MDNYFIKYQEDIIQAYKNIHGKVNYKNIFEDFNEKLTPLIFEILKSYYFEDNFSPLLTKGNSYSKIIFNGKMLFAPFINMSTYHQFTETKKLDIDIIDIKKELINVDPFYSIIFEEDPLKQKINLIKKYEINYSIIKVEENVYEKIKPFHKLSYSANPFEVKENSYYNSYNLEEELKEVLKMPFINFEFNKNRHFVIAYNQNQIVGLTSLTKYSMLFDREEINNHYMHNKFIYNSYMTVAKEFRGNNISIEMMKKSLEFAKENNLIFIRSQPTEDGRSYIEKKIDQIVKNDKKIVCINYDSNKIFSDLKTFIKSINNDNDYSKFLTKFKPLINKINNDISEKNLQLDKIDDYLERLSFIEKENLIYNKDIEEFKELFKSKNKISLSQ